MVAFLKKVNPLQQWSTYKTGLLHAHVHHQLKDYISKYLAPYDLSPFEWIMLGHICDQPQIRSGELAEKLGIEAPLVTLLIDALERKGYVNRVCDDTDRRVKMLSLSDKGKEQVPQIEALLSQKTKDLLRGLRTSEILTYLKVQELIVKKAK